MDRVRKKRALKLEVTIIFDGVEKAWQLEDKIGSKFFQARYSLQFLSVQIQDNQDKVFVKEDVYISIKLVLTNMNLSNMIKHRHRQNITNQRSISLLWLFLR